MSDPWAEKHASDRAKAIRDAQKTSGDNLTQQAQQRIKDAAARREALSKPAKPYKPSFPI